MRKSFSCPNCHKRPKRNPIKPGKFYHWCKECYGKYRVKSYHKNIEKRHESDRIRYQKNRTKRLIKQKAYYWKNKARINAYNRDYGKKNIKRLRIYYREYYWRDPKKSRLEKKLQHRKRRIFEYKAKGDFTDEEWENKKKLHKMRCAMCGKKKKLTVDHIIPFDRGGDNFITNIQPLCKPCNSSKGNKILCKSSKS